jgi:hypothetical protein
LCGWLSSRPQAPALDLEAQLTRSPQPIIATLTKELANAKNLTISLWDSSNLSSKTALAEHFNLGDHLYCQHFGNSLRFSAHGTFGVRLDST